VGRARGYGCRPGARLCATRLHAFWASADDHRGRWPDRWRVVAADLVDCRRGASDALSTRSRRNLGCGTGAAACRL